MDTQNVQGLADEYASALIAMDAMFDVWQQAENVANAGHGPRPIDLYSDWLDAIESAEQVRRELIAAGRADLVIITLAEHAAHA